MKRDVGSKSYVLDACSVIALLKNEPGGKMMSDIIADEENIVYMHYVNLGEVYYDFYRVDGEEKADSVLNVLLKLPIEFVSRIDLDLLKIAGRYKSAGRISYADCFVLAMAEVYNAQVITSDHKEFDKIALKGKLSFRWIR